MSELKPCPFCGADYGFLEIIKCGVTGSSHVYAVMCCECGGRSGRAETKDDAVEAWNRRADNGTS